jgi:hypothetical protein
METNESATIDSSGIEIMEAQERASIDSQVATAKKYPRNLLRVQNNSISIACMSKETAESCRYAKPTGGKNVTGASVHLARIVCQQYGNIRVQQRIKQITQTTIIAEAVAFDMETNYASCAEARRSIIGKNGQRYSESVIETNAMAVMAIAERNAILKVIPKSIIDSVYNEAFKFANGDLSDNAKLLIARDKTIEFFKNEYGVTEDKVTQSIGLKTKEAIKPEHIADLRGFMQALKDKETTVEDLFGISEKQTRDEKNTTEVLIQTEPEKKEVEKIQI